jgi:hypothetical protein
MSDEALFRVAVIVAVAAGSVLVALVARRGTAMFRHPVTIPGYGPGVILFTSSDCGSCAAMRSALSKAGDVREVTYEELGAAFPKQVARVPAVARLDEHGVGWIAFGVVGGRRLRRWLGGP